MIKLLWCGHLARTRCTSLKATCYSFSRSIFPVSCLTTTFTFLIRSGWIKFLMVVHELMIEISLEGKGIGFLPLQ
jgi:hypothetical protein